MTKKDYQKPTMNVVRLQHQTLLLQASEPATLSGSKGEDSNPDTWYDLE